MPDLDQKLGPVRIRAWGLVANFVCNALALYGLAALLRGGPGWPALLLGGAGTVICIAMLARPSRPRDTDTPPPTG